MDSRNVTSIEAVARHEELEQTPQSFADLFARPDLLQRLALKAVLFHEGEIPAGVYILHSGKVDLVHERTDGAERGRTARAGEILGLSAVISGRSHLSSAIARTRCEVEFIEGEEFRCLADDNPAIWFSVLRQLSQDVNESYAVIRKARRYRA